MLKYSEVLTDDDLIAIVRGKDAAAQQVAIAQRPTVSTAVADALIDTGNETAVARLVANEGADLTEAALGRVITSYQGSEAVAESIARRPNLPPAIFEHLVSAMRSEEHTSELQSLMRISYAVFCLKKK